MTERPPLPISQVFKAIDSRAPDRVGCAVIDFVQLRSELKEIIAGSRGTHAAVPHSWRRQWMLETLAVRNSAANVMVCRSIDEERDASFVAFGG